MSGDIVERLRNLWDLLYDDDDVTAYGLADAAATLADEAADEIERLRAHNIALSETSLGELFDEIERLRAAGDALAVAYRTLGGLDVAHDDALVNWEARRGNR